MASGGQKLLFFFVTHIEENIQCMLVEGRKAGGGNGGKGKGRI